MRNVWKGRGAMPLISIRRPQGRQARDPSLSRGKAPCAPNQARSRLRQARGSSSLSAVASPWQFTTQCNSSLSTITQFLTQFLSQDTANSSFEDSPQPLSSSLSSSLTSSLKGKPSYQLLWRIILSYGFAGDAISPKEKSAGTAGTHLHPARSDMCMRMHQVR